MRIKRSDFTGKGGIPVFLYVALAACSLRYYLDWQSASFVTGLIACYFCLSDKNPAAVGEPASFRYGYAALVLVLFFVFLPVKTFLYLAFVQAILFSLESFRGRQSVCLLFSLLLLSPVADYAANLAGFPVRLQLTEWAGNLIYFTGVPVRIEGNMITCKGTEFSVDPACMGLHMLLASLLAGLALIGFYQRKYRLSVRMIPVLLLLIAILCLNMVANLFRIVLLVELSILPENPMHGVIGILCLAIYVLIPLIPASRRLVLRFGKSYQAKQTPIPGRLSWALLPMNGLIAGCMVAATVISLLRDKEQTRRLGPLPSIPGYTVERTTGDVLKLSKTGSLIYLKAIPGFYYTDHTPMICWVGSGYTFHQIREDSLYHHRLYTGVLQKEKETLYTAWWFDNGKRQTPDQLDWRWDVFRGGGNYSIVNITAATRADLEKEVGEVFANHPFDPALRMN